MQVIFNFIYRSFLHESIHKQKNKPGTCNIFVVGFVMHLLQDNDTLQTMAILIVLYVLIDCIAR